MNTNNKIGAGSAKGLQSQPPTMTSSNPSMLLDKFNVGRSTPDSEALASSDDDAERQDQPQPVVRTPKPARRSSWLNETPQLSAQARKGSFASSSRSPTNSHPSTPSAESVTWNSHTQAGSAIGRGAPGSSAFPWGGNIWNSDSRKEPPSRLKEVLPSPTTMYSPASAFFAEPSASPRDASNPLPFAIPLQPKTNYRSQSFSVGQLDLDQPGSTPAGAPPLAGRGNRPHQHSGLHHRPSRPSMLSEMSNDGGLGKVKEVDDDDDGSTNGSSNHGVLLASSNSDAKTIELLARENAMLRQQQYQNARARPRSSASNTFGTLASGYGGLQAEALPEESDYAIDELDELNELQDVAGKGRLERRMSEYAAGQARIPSYVSLEHRQLESVKKAYWQSSLGFGGLGDIPQSRRHSFADVPARQGSVSSIGGEQVSMHEGSLQDQLSPNEYPNRYQEDNAGYPQHEHSASYFGNVATHPRHVDPYNPSLFQQPSAYLYANQYAGGRPSSPHRNMYGLPQPRHNQLLYIVLFKCSRADVFYVQEGTGLSVKPGDLVIVEADRGTDLGTVARDNVDWASAKDLKEHYAEEHYKWLMMYSQGAVGTADGTGAGLMAAANGLQGSAVGGMGPPNQHGMQDPPSGELKPKIIKRLAQSHEIQSLRDKEGNEAKAKRVCMQKVKEHGLHMEILDAEFQMDWKKLTFYYFADAYINFNSLVTDLFKVYKTRIWMSAINPASFASPSLGLQAPSGIGPGAVGARIPQVERRPQTEQASFSMPPTRTYPNVYTQPFTPAAERGNQPSFQSPVYTYGYSPFGSARDPSAQVAYNPYAGGFHTPEYRTTRYPSPHGSTPGHDGNDYGRQGVPPSTDPWINSFQGLSMNSR